MQRRCFSFYILLLIIFLDNVGFGLVYPMFSSLVFNPESGFIPDQMGNIQKGTYLGLLLCLSPLFVFLSSPFLGTFSDRIGRKKVLLTSLIIISISYGLAYLGVEKKNLFLLLLSRAVNGLGAGNVSVVNAAIADMSSEKNKARNFSFYNMAMGVGFTLGPFLGGTLTSIGGYTFPFICAGVAFLFNIALMLFAFKETFHPSLDAKKKNLREILFSLKEGFTFIQLRMILIAAFFYVFGWNIFFEFFPVYLIDKFSFSPKTIGNFFAIAGASFAFCAGVLVPATLKLRSFEKLLFLSFLITSAIIISFLFAGSFFSITAIMVVLSYFFALQIALTTNLVSNVSSSETQGEYLGILESVKAIGMTTAPLFTGAIVGWSKTSPIIVGSITYLLAAVAFLPALRKSAPTNPTD